MSAELERSYYRLLTIAGSDSGGGAGIQADLKTFASLGGYGMTVLTALTAQNTVGVQAVLEVPAEFVRYQIDSVLSDMGADAIKTGMLSNAAVIEAVAERLAFYHASKVVVDPVMVAESGDRLLHRDAISALRRSLIPQADLITPNLHEAETLLGRHIGGVTEMGDAAKRLCDMGARAVLIKGGHVREGLSSRDCLYLGDDSRLLWFEAARIETRNLHGTGCTMAAAITAHLGRGLPLVDAVQAAKQYITAAIEGGSRRTLGKGAGPVHHFHAYW